MVRQRLQNRSMLQFGVPVAAILIIVAAAIFTAQSPGRTLRESVFDLFLRLEARPAAAAPGVALIDIDAESLTRIGPWPWPRTAIAGLVTAAIEADAAAVVVVVPADGDDPLSPEVAVRYWSRTDPSGEVEKVLAQLPTNNAALAAAARTGKVAIGIGRTASPISGWTRSDVLAVDWATLSSSEATGFVAMRTAPAHASIDPGFDETGLVAVSALPTDPDGTFRRTPLLWARSDRPAPSAALAGLLLANDAPAALTPSTRVLHAGGAPITALNLRGIDEEIQLDADGGMRLWLPKDLTLPAVKAWRALDGGDTWTQPLAGRIVFIGENVSPRSTLETSRGLMPISAIHAQLAEQMRIDAVPVRPFWLGWMEGLGALVFGSMALFIALALRPVTTVLSAALMSLSAFAGAFFLFQNTHALVDPLPIIFAAIGAPLLVLLVHIGGMLRGGDVARATFHGALPASTVSRMQTKGPGKLLDGTRRPVCIMSCGLRLPDSVLLAYQARPTDFIALTGAFTDALRRTILQSGGTVDYGEDGRLLGYWNVPEELPNPIEKACGCALKMIEELNRLAENMQSSSFDSAGTGGFSDVKLEIGIAHGQCFAGALGHGTRKRYSVIGDAVVAASQLRQRATLYGPAIITDDQVFDALRHQYAFLDLDTLAIEEGRAERTVYGLSGNSFLKASKAFRTLADIQRELVLSWRNGDYAVATTQLQRLRGIPGVPDAYIELYEKRLLKANNS